MIKDKTHYNIAKSMYPSVSWTTIHNVNKSIDNPKPWWKRRGTAPLLGPLPANMRFTPLQYMKAHRKMNHDWQSAMMMGYMRGGVPGMLAARAHMMADYMSDTIARSRGTAFRDLFEAQLNYNYAMMGKKWWKAGL